MLWKEQETKASAVDTFVWTSKSHMIDASAICRETDKPSSSKTELLMWNIREQLCSAQRSERGIFQRKCANWLVDTSHVCKAMWFQWRLFGEVNLVQAWQPIRTQNYTTGVYLGQQGVEQDGRFEAVKWLEENGHFQMKGGVKMKSEQPVT